VKHTDDQKRELRYREFVRLLAEHERQVAGYVHALVPLWQDAEDVLQETKLRLWEQFDSFQSGTNFAAWAFTIAGYMVRRHRKRCQRERVSFSDDLLETLAREVPAAITPSPDLRLLTLIECVKALSNASRKLLRLFCTGQKKIKDIAHELGQSPDATRMALFRIRQSLSECVERRLRKESNG
jgi:RNA polymerase sigma-70 factor, ECF subfamily